MAIAIGIFVAVHQGSRNALRGVSTSRQESRTTIADSSDEQRIRTALRRTDATDAEVVQVVETLEKIRRGSFAHPNDGAAFGNRERRLPSRPAGYYREYTVPEAGRSTRGPRRLVIGRKGEAYYTRDHYGTFITIFGGGATDDER